MHFRKAFKMILYLISSLIFIALVFIIFAVIISYKPQQKETLFTAEHSTTLSDTAKISILTWNIGYCGLGNDMEFFYDGGKKMRSTKERTTENLKAISKYISDNSYFDFILLQEVDKKARRSYYKNIFDSIQSLIPNATHIFATNYDAKFVPVPLTNPMGRVYSGISTISHAVPSIAERISYPGHYPWPNRLFNLKRCFLVNKYPLENGKELIIINTHNSAYDDGSLRSQQMEYLKDFVLSEYDKGNYIIAGGDWNQSPPDFKPDFHFNIFDTVNNIGISNKFLPGWQWIYDSTTPTNRKLDEVYDAGNTETSLIDFFLISPNVESLKTEGVHLDFINSDHNPVIGHFQLKPLK